MRISLLIAIAFITLTTFCGASQLPAHSDCVMQYDSIFKKNLHVWSEQMPAMQDGKEIFEFFLINFKNTDTDDDWQMSLHMAYVVDTTGKIQDAYILRKKEADYSTKDKAGLRFLRSMPPVTPGYCEGKKVPFLMFLSVRW